MKHLRGPRHNKDCPFPIVANDPLLLRKQSVVVWNVLQRSTLGWKLWQKTSFKSVC